MEFPVLIPARNEEERIRRGLNALTRQSQNVEPIVIINGSADNSADIARRYGATVLESAEGKVPALQEGLRHLGRKALEATLILDADSRPISKHWSQRMVAETEQIARGKPGITWGPYVFKDDTNPLVASFFTLASMQVSWADRHKGHPRTIRGGNTALRIADAELLDDLLAMPNYWPRDDVAIYDTFVSHGANKKVVFHPEAWVYTSGNRLSEALKKIIKERRSPNEIYGESYASEAPQGSEPYNSPHQA